MYLTGARRERCVCGRAADPGLPPVTVRIEDLLRRGASSSHPSTLDGAPGELSSSKASCSRQAETCSALPPEDPRSTTTTSSLRSSTWFLVSTSNTMIRIASRKSKWSATVRDALSIAVKVVRLTRRAAELLALLGVPGRRPPAEGPRPHTRAARGVPPPPQAHDLDGDAQGIAKHHRPLGLPRGDADHGVRCRDQEPGART